MSKFLSFKGSPTAIAYEVYICITLSSNKNWEGYYLKIFEVYKLEKINKHCLWFCQILLIVVLSISKPYLLLKKEATVVCFTQ